MATGNSRPTSVCATSRRVVETVQWEAGVSGERERVDGERREDFGGFLVSRGWPARIRRELCEAFGDEEDEVDQESVRWA